MNNPATEREGFVELVRQALGQLHDRALLQAHALSSILSHEGLLPTAEELQQALLDAIRELRPAQVGPQPTSQWRRYRYLWLRYVEVVRLEEIAGTLGVTDRQARRDHREALEAVAAILWARYQGTPWLPERRGEAALAKGEPLQPDEESAALEAELARLAVEQPHGPTSLAETLEGALLTGTRLIESRKLRLDVLVPPDLPPVAVNRAILRQALMSLLAHVVRQQAEGQLRLQASSDPEGVSLTMSSTRFASQPGPPGYVPQANGETSLELARRMVEREGGSLVVRQDELGREDVLLRLPAAPLTTVLVVDDNLDFLRLCQRYLEGSAYRVLAANLAAEALRAARDRQPDVIVLDVLMPTQDGWELLATLQRDDATRRIPVVVCSVLREPTLALGLGAADFLPKPVTLPSLLAALERAGTRRRASRGSPADIPSAPQPIARPVE